MDPISSVGVGLTVLGSKDILVKVLGPTADYVGGEIKGLVEKSNINLDKIFSRAVIKLGPKLDKPGTVSPRVLKNILDEGRFCEDSLAAEYYGGVLASSKGENCRDDRGVFYMELIKGLSVYQLRAHYLFYYILKDIGIKDANMGMGDDRDDHQIYIPFEVFENALEFSENENRGNILEHIVTGLSSYGLIGNSYGYGSGEHMRLNFPGVPENGGIVIKPTLLGVELFLWADGASSITPSNFLSSCYILPEPVITIEKGSVRINELTNQASGTPKSGAPS